MNSNERGGGWRGGSEGGEYGRWEGGSSDRGAGGYSGRSQAREYGDEWREQPDWSRGSGNEQWRRGQESGWPAYGGARSNSGYGTMSQHRDNEGWRGGYGERNRSGAFDEYGDGGYGRRWQGAGGEYGNTGGQGGYSGPNYGGWGGSSGGFWSGQTTRRNDYGGERWQGDGGWDRDRGNWSSGTGGGWSGGPSEEGDRDRFETGYGRPTGGGYGSYGWSGMRGPGFDEGWNRGPHHGKGPRGYHRSDDRIREEVSDRLEQHSWLDASELDVEVQEGVVTLRGDVDDRRQKRMAEDIAEQVPGVKDVRNELRVHDHAEWTHSQGSSQGQGGATGSSSDGATQTTTAGTNNRAMARH